MARRGRGVTLVWILAGIGLCALIFWIYALVVPEPADILPSELSKPAPAPGDPDFTVTLAAQLGDPVVDGNRIDVLVNGDEIFPPMLEAIRSARESVNFLSYIYWTGDIAQRFAAELSGAARRGVEVRVLLDAYGAHKMRPELVEQMRAAGCRVAWFHPLHWYTLRRANNRTHRKVLVVDGRVGFTGGVGVADEWTGDAQDRRHWRDDHFRIEGPAVRYLQGAFGENWRQATGEVLAGQRMYPELPPAGQTRVVPIVSAAGGSISQVGLLYWMLLRSARESVRIATPYFVPDSSLVTELEQAAERGVEVTLLVPGEHNDSWTVRWASQVHYGNLIAAGVRIFEYQPTMMHAKAVTVDRAFSVIGSSNWDNRSFELNYEITLAVPDSALTRRLRETFDEDLQQAKEITAEDVRRRSAVDRLKSRFAYALREQL